MVFDPNRFTGTARNISASGDKLDVHFSNPDLANKKVTVLILDGLEEEKTLEIPLDGKGKGTAEFPVPAGWATVILTHPTSRDHAVFVGGP